MNQAGLPPQGTPYVIWGAGDSDLLALFRYFSTEHVATVSDPKASLCCSERRSGTLRLARQPAFC